MEEEKAKQRLGEWGGLYLKATKDTYELAKKHRKKGDPFSAYLCAWVSFNNLYSLLSRFSGGEKERMRIVLRMLSPKDVEYIFNGDYKRNIESLNNRWTQELYNHQGIVNMQVFFRGKPPDKSVKRIVISKEESIEGRLKVLTSVVIELLYTVRNNLFHAKKDSRSESDEEVLKTALCLLEPLIEVLLPKAEELVQIS